MNPNSPDYKSVWTESLESIVAKFKASEGKRRKRVRMKPQSLSYKDYNPNTLYLSGYEFVFENNTCYFRRL